jgi:alpha-D-xyloside xylohydrolase
VVVENWGKNEMRVRAYKAPKLPEENWALLPLKEPTSAEISVDADKGVIKNGKITARMTASGRMAFYNQDGKLLLEEYWRNRHTAMDVNRQEAMKEFASALDVDARELRPILGGDFALTARFESDPKEKLFGMGQYQLPYLNLKNCDLEMAHRNSQASVPFALSSLGYGFLWNNPAIGRVSFGKNLTQWQSYSTKWLDYWIVAGDTPAEIEEAYAKATGYAPMMPDYATGFWQCKLRYQTQEELLEVAREHKKRGLPMSVIVAD